jgi:BlaI family penicillinase repressor
MSKDISDAELEIMKILWSCDRKVSFSELSAQLSKTKGWQRQTVNTLLIRLLKKDAITQHKLDISHYTANISEDRYRKEREEELIDRLYGGSAMSLVLSLCQRVKLTEADKLELLKTLEGNDEND